MDRWKQDDTIIMPPCRTGDVEWREMSIQSTLQYNT